MSTRIRNISPPCSPDSPVHLLNRLKGEHAQFLRKLNLLELQYLDMCRDEAPDYAFMQNIVVYIQEYPEQIHHHLEDMIYSILLERADGVEFVQELISEHTQLEVVARELRESLESSPRSAASDEKLKKQLSKFLVWQRQHIYTEESEVFPLAQSVLTQKDWKRLQYMMPILDDPICGKRTWSDYERLCREIEDRHMMESLRGEISSPDLTTTERTQVA